MKKILIIADGILAKQFLEKVMETEAGENSYTIVTYKEETLPKNALKISNFSSLIQPVTKNLPLF